MALLLVCLVPCNYPALSVCLDAQLLDEPRFADACFTCEQQEVRLFCFGRRGNSLQDMAHALKFFLSPNQGMLVVTI